MIIKRLIFVCLTAGLLIGAGLDARAESVEKGQMAVQEPQDSVERQFNALDYSMQKRYRPGNDPFVRMKFMDNTFISVSGGIMDMLNRDNLDYGFGPSATFSVGKWINPYNAIRPSVSWRNFVRKDDVGQFNVFGIGVSHLFNLSSYLGGFRRSRFFEISTVEGLGVYGSLHNSKFTVSAGLNLGFNMNLRLSDAIDFYIEPGIMVYTDGIDHSGGLNWHRYDMEYGVNAGLSVNINSKAAGIQKQKIDRGSTYLALFVGPQFQNSTLVVKEIGIFNAMGPHAGITAGRWINEYFAFQGSLFYSSDKWIKDELEDRLRDTRYMGLRVEGKFNPLMFINGWEDKFFTLPLLFGGEAGYMMKDDRSREINKVYLGLTAACQARFKLLSFLSLYIEPRFSLVPYSIDFYQEYTHEGMRETYYDGTVNVNFGIEFDITALRRLFEK